MAKIIPFPPIKLIKSRPESEGKLTAEIIVFPTRKPTLTERILMSASK